MATTTTNFNFPIPQSTDLVKDGATAIAALGTSVDTQFVDLKGGTTGQVLAKASGTDLDFSWVAQDDSNAIQNAIVDAKGDLIAATANDTPARLAVGNNGEGLIADSSASTGLRWQSNFAAGKNAIINGSMQYSQRGTSFSNPTSLTYTLDRFKVFYDGTGATQTVSQTAFTPGACPTGYEANYHFRWAVTVTGTGNTNRAIIQDIENVTSFAGQAVTVSFFAKADAARTLQTSYLSQVFGTGGSTQVNQALTFNSTSLTTSWQRFTATVTLPSITGKTIGTNSSLTLSIYLPSGSTQTIDIWGVQVEAGSVATAFQTATGTIQGELAACQRYYYRASASSSPFAQFGQGFAGSTTVAQAQMKLPTTMRIEPTLVDYSTLRLDDINSAQAVTVLTVSNNSSTPDQVTLDLTVASGLTANRPYFIGANNSTSAYIGVSAEL